MNWRGSQYASPVAYPDDRQATGSGSLSVWAPLLVAVLFILPVALIPSTKGRFFHVPPLPLAWWSDYFLLLLVAVAVTCRLFSLVPRVRRETFWWFLVPGLLLSGYQIVSITWNGQDSVARRYAVMQAVMMAAMLTAGTLLASGTPLRSRLALGRSLTLLVAGVAAVYASLSFLFPGLRPSTEWTDRITRALGFIRVFGPLGTATTLNFALIPALGFSIGAVYAGRGSRPRWLLVTMFLVLAVVSTGSRMGIFALAGFCVVLTMLVRLRAMLLLIPVLATIAGLVAAIGVPARFQEFRDSARMETYRTALRAYASSPENVWLGAGHGALYTKLHDDSIRKAYGEDRWFLLDQRTEHGYSLRNSHSAILRSLAETGPVGLCLTAVPLVWLATRPFSRAVRSAPRSDRVVLRCAQAGCIAVIPAMLVEEFFISAFWIGLLWTMFSVIAGEGADRPQSSVRA